MRVFHGNDLHIHSLLVPRGCPGGPDSLGLHSSGLRLFYRGVCHIAEGNPSPVTDTVEERRAGVNGNGGKNIRGGSRRRRTPGTAAGLREKTDSRITQPRARGASPATQKRASLKQGDITRKDDVVERKPQASEAHARSRAELRRGVSRRRAWRTSRATRQTAGI